ncbi:MAG: S-layer protein, partial [Candidatus Aenigmatarchaeota archaeon]
LSAQAGGQVTYQKAMPIQSSVAKLDTNVAEPSAVETNLILVGGPCANMLVQELAQQNATDVPTCNAWSQDTPEIQLVENAFAEGQTALVVAGMNAEDTLSAARKLQTPGDLPDQATLNV